MYKLLIKKLNAEAIIPNYAHEGDAGLDLYSIEEKVIEAGKTELIHTGISIQLPDSTEAQIRPRSGLALKHSITVLNTPGTIDAGYRGEICIIIINHGNNSFKVEKGMKIAQMIIKPVYKVEVKEVRELDETCRGANGFGSSGLK